MLDFFSTPDPSFDLFFQVDTQQYDRSSLLLVYNALLNYFDFHLTLKYILDHGLKIGLRSAWRHRPINKDCIT